MILLSGSAERKQRGGLFSFSPVSLCKKIKKKKKSKGKKQLPISDSTHLGQNWIQADSQAVIYFSWQQDWGVGGEEEEEEGGTRQEDGDTEMCAEWCWL